MKPSIGRIVHYVSHGSPVLPDGSQSYGSECRAAIVTEVGDIPEIVSLCALNPTGAFFTANVSQDEYMKSGGTWHWPERV